MDAGLLTLDLSSQVGYAYGPAGLNPRCETIDLRGIKRRAAKFQAFMGWLNGFLKSHPVVEVGYEAPMSASVMAQIGSTKDTMLWLVGLCAITETVCEAHGLNCSLHEVQDVRAHFVGQRTFKSVRDSVNPKKVIMTSSAQAKAAVIVQCRTIGINVLNDHEADAAALHSYLSGLRKPSSAMRVTPLFGGQAWR